MNLKRPNRESSSEYIEHLHLALIKARKSEDWKGCIKLCRSAIKRSKFLNKKQWYGFHISLAVVLMKIDPKLNINEVISLYKKILRRKGIEPYQQASIHRNLGYVYNEIRSYKNLILSIKHYQQALQFFSQESYPEDWALIKSMMGMIYHGLWLDNKREGYLNAALKNYREALQALDREHYPENWKEITGLIKEFGKSGATHEWR